MRDVELSGDDLGHLEYAIRVIKERHLSGGPPQQNYRDNSLERRPTRTFHNQDRIYNQDRNYNQDRGGYNNNNFQRGGFNHNFDQNQSRGRPSYHRGDFNNGHSQMQTYVEPKPTYTPKPVIKNEESGEWDDPTVIKVTTGNTAPAAKPKVDDWETEEVTVNQNQPSVNVYTRSSNNNWNDSREKKFKARDDYGGGGGFKLEPYSAPEEKEFEPIDWDKINKQADEARKARWEKCPLMIKDFYHEHEATKAMTQQEVDDFRLNNMKIAVSRVFDEDADPTTMPKPITRFEYAFEHLPDLMDEIKKAGFEKPSPIQSQMWPILLKGEDCIGIAQTGKIFFCLKQSNL